MLQKESVLDVNDSSGYIKTKIISIFKGVYSRPASIVFLAKKKVKKNFNTLDKKKLGIVVGTKYGVVRKSGIKVSHSKNVVVLLQDFTTFFNVRFKGAFFSEIKKTSISKLNVLNRYYV
jgi:ribosomal protein L14